jgi:hypothetical protein
MPRISTQANLNQRYKNHCIRATITTNLHATGLSITEIMSVIGHRNVQSLTSYIRPSEEARKKISGLLSHSNSVNDFQLAAPAEFNDESLPSHQSLAMFNDPKISSALQICPVRSGNIDITMSKSAASCQFLSGNITSSTINVNIYHAK